jgi:5-methyltetrahydropteroyltriglutamate--homocysteine methyltransferase
MIESCDAGSLPFTGDFTKYLHGASNYGKASSESTLFFENNVVSGFIDKAEAGIDVPNYPQYRDMTQMFIDMIDGLTKVNGGYVETGKLTLKVDKGLIPEAQAIQNRSHEIREKLGQTFKLRMCITGPYTISSVFAYKDKNTFTRLGNALAQIIEASMFNTKHGSVKLVSVDDPVFGFIDDPLLEHGSEGRENLLKAWETIMQKIQSKGAQTCLHLHNTSNELFWQIKPLNIIESHVNDPFYQSKRTKQQLEATDKFLKTSIAITDFDQLIRNRIISTATQKISDASINEQIAEAWKNLNANKTNPLTYLESIATMKYRLKDSIQRFGENRIAYAGPECGMRGYPTYESAIECLKKTAEATRSQTA